MPIFRDGRHVPVDFSREARRYEAKLLRALRDKFWELIETVDLIGRGKNDPNRTVKLRIKDLREFRFKFGRTEGRGEGAGQLSQEGEGASGQVVGDAAGTQPGGNEYDEFEIDRFLLEDMFFERWQLPPPQPREDGPLTHEKEVRLAGVRRKGAMSQLARRETSRARLERVLQETDTDESEKDALVEAWRNAPFYEDILRFYRFSKEEEGTKAVQLNARDISGSMLGIKQEMCRVCFTYVSAWRERRFSDFEARHIVHTTEAEETTESDFFRRSASGGTKMSSALEKMRELIADRYRPDEWNVYGMYASDGENQSDDNEFSFKLIEQLLDDVRLFVYLETFSSGQMAGSPLYQKLLDLSYRRRNLVVAKIGEHTPAEVRRVLDAIFGREWEVEQDDSR